MKTRIKWVENMCLLGETENGHTITMDSAPEFGGHNLGVRPMGLLLLGLGGCTAMDVLSILRKQRLHLTDFVIEVEGKRAEADPKIFTEIHVRYILTGYSLKEAQVKRAIELSTEKYCSVLAMLSKSAEITHDYQIIEAANNPVTS